MRRSISAMLLIAFLLISVLTSCGGEVSQQTTTAEPSVTTEPAGDEYGYIDPKLTKKDFGGRKFVILYPTWSLYNNYYFADEYNGEVVNDALYDRARRVEEMFNIKFEYVTQGYIETIFPEVQKVVTAGLPDYDLALTHCASSLTGFVTANLLISWNDIPGIDLSMPYWNQSVRENFEVDGMLPFMSSDYILPDVNSIFFNKDFIDKLGLENPYDIVASGKWTWEKLGTMAKTASKDLNGDSIMDANDQYGFVAERGWQFTSALTACNQNLFGKDDDKLPTVVCNNEKTQNILEILCTLIYRDDTSYVWDHSVQFDPNVGGKPPVDFASDRSLFYLTPLSLATTFRDAQVEYGIIPLPKYDENQEDYLTLNWAGFMCVPGSVSDLELVGVVTEMLAAESCRTVIPAFYDVLLGEKVARDKEAKDMLDIIFNNNVYDLGVNLNYYKIVSGQLANDSPDNSSYFATNIATIEKAISDYIEGCQNYK